VTRTNQLPH